MEIKRRRNVYLNARRLVQLAIQKGYDYEEIAKICDVSAGSVQRWLSTDRADASKIKALVDTVGQTYLSAESVGEILIELYKNRGKNNAGMRYRITKVQLKRIAGRSTLRDAFVDDLYLCMLNRGYYLIESEVDDQEIYIIIRKGQLLKHVADKIKKADIARYYKNLSDQIEIDEED